MQDYRMIIADDERVIRKGLVNSVDWSSLGFSVVADVMDGQDVLDYLKDHQVDVVFSDIQMCQISGLEVARWVRENRPEVKVILISGYKEFDYVKEAMELKVHDYVLKPIDLKALEETFRRVKRELDDSRNNYENKLHLWMDFLENPECQSVLMLEGVLLESVINGNIVKAEEALSNWRNALDKVKQQYILQLVMHIMEFLYKRVEKEEISLEPRHEKEQVFSKLRELSGASLIQEAGDTLYSVAEALSTKKSVVFHDVVKKVKEFIDSHISEDFGVEEVAAYVYLSRSHLSREFKSQVGISIIDYIIQRRMEKAKEMIKQTELSADEIGAAVGYTDTRYFQRSFKKYTGLSIREYRNLQR